MVIRAVRIARRTVRLLPGLVRALRQGWVHAPAFPRHLQIEHIARCNLKCVMCAHGIDPPPPRRPDMSFETFCGILGQFRGRDSRDGFGKLEALSLQGVGEPLLHRDTLAMLRYAREQKLFTAFVSNMTVMTDAMAEALVSMGHGRIIASVDAIDPALFADIRRGAKFDILTRVLENIARIQRTKERLQSDAPEILVNSLLMKRTLPQVPELVDRLKALGVSQITFTDVDTSGIAPSTRFADGSRCDDQSLATLPRRDRQRILDGIKALDSAACRVVVPEDWPGAGQPLAPVAILTCEDLWEKPFVTVEGVVTPCCYAPNKEDLPMGDLTQQSFEQIWFGASYQRLRWQHLSFRYPARCYACPQLVKIVAPSSLVGRCPDPALRPRNPVFLGDRPYSFGLHEHGGPEAAEGRAR